MLTSLQTTLLSSLSAFLSGTTYEAPSETEWKELAKESIKQAVALSCLQGLDANNIPEDVKQTWQNYAMRALRSNVNIHAHHAYLHQLLQQAGLPYVILKGSASAYYYTDPLMRAMGDVDFLVPKATLEKTGELLKAEGFVTIEENHVCHIVFQKDKIHLEMHFEPAGMPEGELGEKIRGYLSDIFEQASEVEVGGERFQKPNDFHHGLIILMHTYHHMLSEGIGLRHLCDWAAFVRHFEGEGFAEIFQEKLSAVGLWKFAQILSYTSYLYLGLPYREWMGTQDEALCESVIQDVFAGGNFGSKDESRTVQGLSISDRGKGGVKKKSKISQMFSSLNKAGKTRYPRLAKIPILNLFCFIPLGFRYVFRVMTGKRKRLKIAGSMKEAENRKQIYKQFELFEIGDKE